ncbi:MAG: glutamine--tRNA ligase/YqeY domain fusion protein [Bacteroidales bacterium]|nr:glutamine--tRNA ligase/YqeY domain fusion protein [Bacteroidales bacterium]MDD3521498.1 glutamine--tRNA ligase/YqeY domain fusion protein [Bacteroidales bacterium]MDD4030532.1 glutamine--tRNA ligase/YqeY domain fusion protein [Bacteroidales bacterium]MDD4434869.1 glutamine--tRNA ligase/YqeY domain fusion protein [Bacteroidales bacterium]MDD5732552.1 glutamine--tRNA ligase/YqeY domain fusion protein [Bacteroidales bacterium]
MNAENTQTTSERSLNFIEEIIQEDLTRGKHQSIITRFPPEPNGYLHIGHAKSICLNFGLARKFGGKTNLRFDDTNPTKEDTEYVDSIKEDINWLGFEWANEFYASDYFEQLYQWAHVLIRKGLAYVDDQSQEEIRLNRGTVTTPGKDSPWRNRSIEENADLFTRMRAGEFPDGSRVLRAKIDMSHPNMLMRDPLMYRIIHEEHHRTGNAWCIYPMYDYAHGQCDSIEHITHSVCTLEFDVHRPLYDWFIEQLDIFPSRQYEFARLNITHTVMSKRKLLELVQTGLVDGWDDPRMPTICGLRRRGYTPSSIRLFSEKVGVAKRDNVIDISLMEWCIRDELNKTAPRHMAVLDPLKVIITNYPEDREEYMKAPLNPEDPSAGERLIPFSREIYIERDDFMEDPPKKYFRLMPGGEVRLKYGYIIKCEKVVKDNNGQILELHCSLDPGTKPGTGTWRSVKGTIHWLSARHAIAGEVRLFDRLFTEAYMGSIPGDRDYRDYLNPDSLKTVQAYIDNTAALLANQAVSGQDHTRIRFQFERLGYFVPDYESTPERPVFNRICTLKDSFGKKLNQP